MKEDYQKAVKLVPAIFYQFFIFSPNDNLSKTMRNVFISSKKLSSFLRYSYFCNVFPSFSHSPDSKQQMEVEIGLHKFTDVFFGITQKPLILYHQTWSDNT